MTRTSEYRRTNPVASCYPGGARCRIDRRVPDKFGYGELVPAMHGWAVPNACRCTPDQFDIDRQHGLRPLSWRSTGLGLLHCVRASQDHTRCCPDRTLSNQRKDLDAIQPAEAKRSETDISELSCPRKSSALSGERRNASWMTKISRSIWNIDLTRDHTPRGSNQIIPIIST